MPESKFYYLDGRLLRVANEHDRHLTYTHVLCAGDRVLSWHLSEADAETWAEEERRRLRQELGRLMRLHERRNFVTNPSPDEGTVVRLPDPDVMYPTQRALRTAAEKIAGQIDSIHVRALEVTNKEKAAPARRRKAG